MNIKWLIGLAMLWLIGFGLDATIWGGYFTTRTGESVVMLNYLFSLPPMSQIWNWVLRWLGLLTWDFTFLDGGFQIFRYIMIAVSIGITYGLARDWISIPIFGRK